MDTLAGQARDVQRRCPLREGQLEVELLTECLSRLMVFSMASHLLTKIERLTLFYGNADNPDILLVMPPSHQATSQ